MGSSPAPIKLFSAAGNPLFKGMKTTCFNYKPCGTKFISQKNLCVEHGHISVRLSGFWPSLIMFLVFDSEENFFKRIRDYGNFVTK